MKLRRLAVVCCMVLTLSLVVHAADGPKHPFFFFVITDVQLGMFDHDQDLTRETDNLERLVAAANRLHPAFIVNCGDIVNQAGNSDEIQRYQAIMAKLDPKIMVLPPAPVATSKADRLRIDYFEKNWQTARPA